MQNAFQVYFKERYICGKIRYRNGTNPYIIECAAQTARKITIVGKHQSGILTLCEVQVFFRSNKFENGKYRKTYSVVPHKTYMNNNHRGVECGLMRPIFLTIYYCFQGYPGSEWSVPAKQL